MLSNDLLRTRLNNTGYYETTTTPGLWRHKWRPIMFVLIVDDFGIEYVGDHHLHHLRTVLTTHYTITEDLDRKNICWHRPQLGLHKNPPPTHMWPLHGRLHFQPAPQVWPQSSCQTSTFPAPPPLNQLQLQRRVCDRRRHKPQTQQ